MDNPKPSVPWRIPKCGGIDIHGLETCCFDGTVWNCCCLKKPSGFHFEYHFYFAQHVYLKKLHLSVNCTLWDECAANLFSTGALRGFRSVQGEAMKSRFFDTMISDVSKRHDVGVGAAGFECHPAITPYDKLILKMIKEIEEKKEQARLLQGITSIIRLCLFVLMCTFRKSRLEA
jgi:hypothetical protein